MKKVLLIVGGIVVVIVVLSQLSQQPSDVVVDVDVDVPTTVTRPPETISATDLYAAYEANEVSADQTYGGQTVEVSGVIGDIGLDILDKPYVTLETDGVWSVQCFFSTDDSDALADLAAGEEVSLVGIVDGLAIGTNLTVNDCQIAP